MAKAKIKIDWDLVEQYLQQQSSGMAIAAMIGISRECLYERVISDKGMTWADYKAKHSAIGVERLRHSMYQMAMVDKVPSVAIFLSKNLLGYSDKIEQKVEVKEWKVQFDDSSTDDADIEDINDMD